MQATAIVLHDPGLQRQHVADLIDRQLLDLLGSDRHLGVGQVLAHQGIAFPVHLNLAHLHRGGGHSLLDPGSKIDIHPHLFHHHRLVADVGDVQVIKSRRHVEDYKIAVDIRR